MWDAAKIMGAARFQEQFFDSYVEIEAGGT